MFPCFRVTAIHAHTPFCRRFDPVFLDERWQELQGFLGRALVKIQVTNSQHMLNFLEVRARDRSRSRVESFGVGSTSVR